MKWLGQSPRNLQQRKFNFSLINWQFLLCSQKTHSILWYFCTTVTLEYVLRSWGRNFNDAKFSPSRFPAPVFPKSAASAAKSLQSCLTLCDPMDSSPPGSPIPGILQARTLEWVAISFSNEWKWKVKVKSLSRVRLLATSWTAAHQAPPSMGFSRQEYWSGVPLLSLSHSLGFCNSKYQFVSLVVPFLTCLGKGELISVYLRSHLLSLLLQGQFYWVSPSSTVVLHLPCWWSLPWILGPQSSQRVPPSA